MPPLQCHTAQQRVTAPIIQLARQSSLTPAAETTLDELSQFLTANDLSQYEVALRQFGCAELDDLRELQAEDMTEMGMTVLEQRRLSRKLTE